MSDHPGAGATAAPLSATHVDHAACVRADASLTRAFAFLGKRWNAILLRALGSGPAGFRELAREVVGISDSVLSDRLGDLAATGLIVRTVSEGPPVSVSYALTPRGEALMPALDQISQWAAEYLPEVPGGSC
ncbi:winged helix-turn-helix transcriptional regulator [Pseudonocardia benzenivorans]|jgi:DNA-binding HxlR family transcriptional regulator|uniref:Transcriptional regulator, HxlR family n=2 Tax=Pseudonocardia TaxID=1847 RepID=F4CUI2_PSEUX|nr:helix-turn-helix domain-containing protein [Pseudonocardia dioxanivorans]AEA25372.1 transcriptional regulator, HxlR family [Pseudonocardia dioxanivorans CB1190]GJF02338.1 transcriptional regulator [Pseudonocardia sp. D17]